MDSSATTFVVSTSQGVLSTKGDMSCLQTTHEDADQIIILHAANTAHNVGLLERQLYNKEMFL